MTVYNLGSINIDHVYRVPHLPAPGETLSALEYSQGLGGKGANQSVAAARAGAICHHIGAIGPSSGWVLAFSVLATLGLFAGLFVPRRRLWVKARTTPDGVHVEYAGLARGEDPALARAVDEFATRHAHALGVDQPAKDTP